MGLMTAGGGLTSGKLKLATAAENEVLSGKSFYAGDKVLKTGSMPNHGAWSTTLTPGNSVTIPQGYHNGGGKVNVKAVNACLAQSTDRSNNPAWTFSHVTVNGINVSIGVSVCHYDSVQSATNIYSIFTFQHINPYFKLSARVNAFIYPIGNPGAGRNYSAGEQICYVSDTANVGYVAVVN